MLKNNRPNLYGVISTDDTKESGIGKIAVWKHERQPAEKKPQYIGNVEMNGKRYKVAMWENTQEG
jgi:hypothetical protein